MYAQHFNFSEPPFSIAPNPRYVYLSPQHREALAHLLYGISMGGGFVALTGEVGTGKTTLCRCLLEQLPEDVDIAVIFNPRLNPRELVASICDELRIPHPQHRASLKLLIDLLNHYLLDAHSRGRRTVVLIDEAQNLSHDVLEQIRLLTNLETNDTKLLQIILVGQPELNTLLKRQNLRQLSQRISARYHLRPLSPIETAAYIRHRIAVSGGKRRLFSRMAEAKTYRLSAGIPRVINLICDRALLGAYTLGKTEVGYSIVRKAAREVLPAGETKRFMSPVTGTLATVAAMLFAGVIYLEFGPNLDPGSMPGKLAAVLEKVKTAVSPNPGPALQQAGNAGQSQQKEASVESNDGPTNTEDLPKIEALPAGQPNVVELTTDTPISVPPPTGEGATNAGTEPNSTALAGQPQPSSTSAMPGGGPIPAPSAEPSFTKLAAEPNLTRKAAFAHLFTLWNIKEPMSDADACLLAKQNGLRCLFQKGNWPQLRSFDHPAVLELVLPDGSKRYATLVQIRDDKAQLFLGDRTYDFELADILPFWRGDAVLLWKPPDNYATSIKLGDEGETVKWLRHRLGVAAPAETESYFDENLRARVAAFQMEHGLAPDGVVGTLTLIHLNKKIKDPAVPRLGSNLD